MPCVVLVGPELEENLGLRYIASSLEKAGFPVRIQPLDHAGAIPAVRDAILADPPDVVGLSLAFQWRAMDVLALAVALREGGYSGKIVGGGHFSAFTHLQILGEFPEVDLLCRYEAEETMVQVLRAFAEGLPVAGIPGLALRGDDGRVFTTPLPRAPDLASLPWPDRRGEPITCLGHRVAALVASRGCYAHCSFCCIAAWHRQAEGGERFRLRPVADLAQEMAFLYHEKGCEIFIFHDDDFFVPGQGGVMARMGALADALDERGVGRIGTVVKARPNDVNAPLFRFMQERLGLIRLFLGIENDAEQGLLTLHRRVTQGQNHAAMEILRALDIYTCFNLLVFDPDATLESLEDNIRFMERYADCPLNFGRVELYAGTPLLQRMQAEGRCRGDWLGWDYSLASPEIQRVFDLCNHSFYPRNFAAGALANRLQGTRFDVEVARHFHADRYRPEWMDEARDLSRVLATDSAGGLREIVRAVRSDADIGDLPDRLRATEAALNRRAFALEAEIQETVGAWCHHVRPRQPAL